MKKLPGDLEARHQWVAMDGSRHSAVFRGSSQSVDAWVRARVKVEARRHRFEVSDPVLPFRYTVHLA